MMVANPSAARTPLARPGARATGQTAAAAALGLAAALAIALLPLDLAIVVVGGAIAAVAIAARPRLGLLLLAFSVPYESVRQLSLGAFNVGSTEALVALTGLGWALRALAFRLPVRVPALTLPVLLLIGFGGLSAITAREPALALKELVKWLELLVVWVAGVNVLSEQGSDRGPWAGLPLVAALLLAGVSEALIGGAQFLLQLGPPAFRFGRFLRAFGTFNQPNPYGGYLISVLPLALALMLFGWRAWRTGRLPPGGGRRLWLLAVLATLLLAAALGMSLSRGAWLGCGIAAIVVASLFDARTLRYVGLAAVVALLVSAAGVANLLPASVADRLTDAVQYFGVFDVRTVELTPRNWPVVERMAHWQAGWEMFLDHPLSGIGLGNYPVVYTDPRYLLKPNFKDPLGHAHNLYINFLAEGGLPVLAAYLVFWLGALVATARAARSLLPLVQMRPTAPPPPSATRRTPPGRPAVRPLRGESAGACAEAVAQVEAMLRAAVVVGVLGALIAMTVHNFFDNLTVHGLNVQVALLLALVYAGSTPQRAVLPFQR